MERLDRGELVNWYVGVLVVLQLVGLLLIQSALDHDPGPLMAWIQGLPPGVRSLLSPLIVVAIPAILSAVLVGVVVFGGLELVGVNVPFIGTYPLFLGIAYTLAVLGVSAVRHGRI